MGVYGVSIGRVWCPSCGFVSELHTSDRRTDVWTQLAGFLDCNGCPECPGDLDLIRAGFLDRATAGLH